MLAQRLNKDRIFSILRRIDPPNEARGGGFVANGGSGSSNYWYDSVAQTRCELRRVGVLFQPTTEGRASIQFNQEAEMKNIDGVLKEKELELEAMKKEVEALRTVAFLLDDPGDASTQTVPKIPARSEGLDVSRSGTAD